MANFFDQFDEAPAQPQSGNFFDRFDEDPAPAQPARVGRKEIVAELERSGAIGPYSFLPGGQMLNRAIGKPTRQAMQDVADDPKGAAYNFTRNLAFGWGDEAGGVGAGLGYLLRGGRDGESLRYVDENGDIRARDGVDGDLPSEGFGGYLGDRAADVFAHGYEKWREINREGKRFTEEKPVAGITTAIAGGLPGGAAAYKATGKLTAPLVKNAPGFVKGIDTAARSGAIGYLTGFGLGEGLDERLNTANTVGAISAVAPGAINVASSIPGVVGKAGGYLAKKVLPGYSKKSATMRANYAAADEFGINLTRGEASGNARAMQHEDDMFKGSSTVNAQNKMRNAEDNRAAAAAKGGLGIGLRGQPAVADDIGEAGEVFKTALRKRLDALEAKADKAYQKAFAAAKAEAVPPSDELGVRVQDVIEQNFLDSPKAEKVISRLQTLIREGKADFSHVERARQQLNTIASDAYNSGDSATAAAARAIRGELDDWTARTMQNPDARKTMAESRGIFREMKQLYASGGPKDVGGKGLERAMELERTGNQVMDGILGKSDKTIDANIAAIRRIKKIATQTTKSGRIAKNKNTAGNARFNSADQQPTEELQALREGVLYKLTNALRDKQSGAQVPAQTVVSNLDAALTGRGKQITQELFTPEEIAALTRYRDAMAKLIKPAGIQTSSTPVSLKRMAGAATNGLFRTLFGVVKWPLEEVSGHVEASRALSRPVGIYFPESGVAKAAGKIGRGLDAIPRAVNRVSGPSASTISAATVQADFGDGEDSPIMSRYGFDDGRTALDDLLEAQ